MSQGVSKVIVDKTPGLSLNTFLTRLIWLCVGPLLVLAAYLAIDNVRTAKAQRDNQAMQLAANFATAIDQHLHARISALNMLARSPLVDDLSRHPDLYQQAVGFQQSFGSHVILADSGMQMLFNTRTPYGTALPRLPSPRGKAAAARAIETGQPAVGDIVFGPVAKEPLVAIAIPVMYDGKLRFMVLSTFETRQFQDLLEQIALPEGWAITLHDSIGDPIARRAPAGMRPLEIDADGRAVVALKESPWSVLLEIPEKTYRAPTWSAALWLSAAMLAAILASFLGGKLASRRLGRAVATLVEGPGTDNDASSITEITRVHHALEEAALRRDTAEAAQHDSEQRFRATFEQAAVGIALVSPDGRWLRVNRKLSEIVGYAPDELLTKTFQDITHPDDLNADLGKMQQVLAGEIETYSMEKRYLQRDGQIVWINLTVSLVRRADGSPDYFISVVEDIQARKAAQASAARNAERLRELARTVGQIAEVRDLQSLMAIVRSTLRQLVGADGVTLVLRENGYCHYADEDAMGPLWKGQRFPLENCISGWAMLNNETVVIEDIYLDPRIPHAAYRPTFVKSLAMAPVGLEKPVAAIGCYWASPHLASSEELVMHHAMAEAMSIGLANLRLYDEMSTARQAAEMAAELATRQASALHESEERLRLFIDHAPASLAMFDRDMRYLAVSRRWLDDYALGDSDILGHSHYQVFPEISQAWKEIHQRGLAGEVIRADEDCFVRENGNEQWLRWEVRPWHANNGGVGGIVIFSEDITRYKLAQLEILRLNSDLEQRIVERTAELTAANQELDSFAYAVSHDLRAPLRAMSGFAQALQEDFAPDLKGDARTYLDQITIASHKMGELIDGLLLLSRSTRGQLERDPIDLSVMARQIAEELSQDDPKRQICWEIEEGLQTTGDVRMIELVMRNLLGNAWKYTSHVGRPSIRVYSGNIGDQAGICIGDNGAGFDLAHADRLFKPFQRLHRQDEFPGIGIGLATVQRIVHRHGGEICATATPGGGATFCFSLSAGTAKEKQ